MKEILALKHLYPEDCGSFVDSTLNYLIAHPDGLVGEDSIVKYHCLSEDNEHINDLVESDSTFCLKKHPLSDTLLLKRDHSIYYQIQGQLKVTRR